MRRRAATQVVEAEAQPVVVDAAPPGEPEAPDPAAAELAAAVEALLVSSDRPLPAGRLAEVLGLAPEGSASASDQTEGAAEPPWPEPGAETPGDAAPRKKGKRPLPPATKVRGAVERLNAEYERTGRSFRIEAVAGGYRLMTLPRFAPVLEAMHGRRERASLSRAAIETLAIIAYKQPITRATLEAIRGVACGEVLRSLTERRLISIVGRAEELGRPILYGTSKRFLETFGLSSLKDLPSVEEFRLRGGAGEDA